MLASLRTFGPNRPELAVPPKGPERRGPCAPCSGLAQDSGLSADPTLRFGVEGRDQPGMLRLGRIATRRGALPGAVGTSFDRGPHTARSL
jgi:hypothetical protein